MLVTIPVSRSDSHLCDAMVKSFTKFHPGANHSLLIVCSPNAQAQAAELLPKLQPYFVNAAVESFSGDNNFDWPRACNFYFQQTCYLINKYTKPNHGFLWMELDSVPLAQNWLTILEQEYYADAVIAQQERRPFYRYMGAKEATIQAVLGEKIDGGYHMGSVGVYPADIATLVPVLKSITSINRPFSAHIKWYPIKNLNISPLIQNNRDTSNYRKEGDQIICDSVARNAFDVHFNEPLSSKAVLLHGCKDGSLVDIVDDGRKVDIIVRQAVIPPPVTAPVKPQVLVNPSQPMAPVFEGTQVDYPKLPPPTVVHKWGSFAGSAEAKTQAQYAPDGMPIVPTAPIVEQLQPSVVERSVEPQPISTEATPAPVSADPKVPQEKPKASTKTRSGKRVNRAAWSPERRAAASERMKEIQARRKATPDNALV